MKRILLIALMTIGIAKSSFTQVAIKGRSVLKSDFQIGSILVHIVNDPGTIDFFEPFATTLRELMKTKGVEARIYIPTHYDSLEFQENIGVVNAIAFISSKELSFNPNTGKRVVIHEIKLINRESVDKTDVVWKGTLKLTLSESMKNYNVAAAKEIIRLWAASGYVRDK